MNYNLISKFTEIYYALYNITYYFPYLITRAHSSLYKSGLYSSQSTCANDSYHITYFILCISSYSYDIIIYYFSNTYLV